MESNLNIKFMNQISKLEPIEFIGLAKLLGVKVAIIKEGESTPTARDFTDVLEDVMAAFSKLNRIRKREIFTLLKKANKARRGVINASNTENTESNNNDQKV